MLFNDEVVRAALFSVRGPGIGLGVRRRKPPRHDPEPAAECGLNISKIARDLAANGSLWRRELHIDWFDWAH